MSRTRAWVVIVMALLWAPITWHCLLEVLPGFEFLHCAAEAEESEDCSDDSCASVESGDYKVQDNPDLLKSKVTFLAAAPPALKLFSADAFCSSNTFSPAYDLPKVWQFETRAALPVRAPSIAS